MVCNRFRTPGQPERVGVSITLSSATLMTMTTIFAKIKEWLKRRRRHKALDRMTQAAVDNGLYDTFVEPDEWRGD